MYDCAIFYMGDLDFAPGKTGESAGSAATAVNDGFRAFLSQRPSPALTPILSLRDFLFWYYFRYKQVRAVSIKPLYPAAQAQ